MINSTPSEGHCSEIKSASKQHTALWPINHGKGLGSGTCLAVPAPWEAEAERSPESRSSGPDGAAQNDLIAKEKEKEENVKGARALNSLLLRDKSPPYPETSGGLNQQWLLPRRLPWGPMLTTICNRPCPHRQAPAAVSLKV